MAAPLSSLTPPAVKQFVTVTLLPLTSRMGKALAGMRLQAFVDTVVQAPCRGPERFGSGADEFPARPGFG
jgi:hypothetical protein